MAGYIGSKSSVTQVDGYSEAEADAEFVNDPNGAITVSGSNVGIGTSSPSAKLDVGGVIQFLDDNTPEIKIIDPDDSNYALIGYSDGTMDLSSNHGNEAGGANVLRMLTGGTERMRIDSSGNVGIGTTSLGGGRGLTVANGAISVTSANLSHSTSSLVLGQENSSTSQIRFYGANTSTAGVLQFTGSSSDGSVGGERMRIDSSGNLLVGKTSSAFNTAGFELFGNADKGKFWSTRDGGVAAAFNRKSSDGDIALFAKDGTTVGSIRSNSGARLAVNSEGSFGLLQVEDSNCFFWSSLSLSPFNDNTRDLGESGFRYDDVYATNGTIQTSDFNEKQDIASLTATEMLVGKRISALFKTFRWKDSVAEKGDNARTHTGVIAQDVQAAFTAEGLDAGDYALFISSTWWEHDVDVPAVEAVEAVEAVTETTTDEDGNEVVTVITEAVEAVEAKDAYTRTDTYDTEDEAPEGATSKTRMGIRYPELLSFVAAYNEQRFASIEARLTALET
jgi:hypothetical protein